MRAATSVPDTTQKMPIRSTMGSILGYNHSTPHKGIQRRNSTGEPKSVPLLHIRITTVVVQSLNHVQLSAIPWTAAPQASPSFTISQSLVKLMSIELVMPSNHLILCHALLLLPSIYMPMHTYTHTFAETYTYIEIYILSTYTYALPCMCIYIHAYTETYIHRDTYTYMYSYMCTAVYVFVQSLSRVRLFVTPWTVAHQAPLSSTISWSLYTYRNICMGIPGGGKEPACQCRRCKTCKFNPWVKKTSWNSKWQPVPLFSPRKFHGQKTLVGYSPWGHKEPDTHRCIYIHTYTRLLHVYKPITYTFHANIYIYRHTNINNWSWSDTQQQKFTIWSPL